MSTDDKEDAFISVLMALVLSAPMSVLTSLVRGWAVSKLWGWFVVPVFALPPLSMAAAFGLSIVAGLMTHQLSLAEEDPKHQGTFRRPFTIMLASMFVSGYSVLVGKIVVSWWM